MQRVFLGEIPLASGLVIHNSRFCVSRKERRELGVGGSESEGDTVVATSERGSAAKARANSAWVALF